MTNDENIFLEKGLLEQYALDMCSPDERLEVESMLASSERVRSEYEQIQIGIERLAKSRAVSPPSSLRHAILSDLEEESPVRSIRETPSSPNVSWLRTAAVIAAIAAIGMIVKQGMDINKLQSTIAGLESKSDHHEQENLVLKETILDLKERTAFISATGTKKILLEQEQSDLQLVAYWNEDRESGLLDVSRVPKAPSGKCFQLWADVEGEMMPVAVLRSGGSELQVADFHANAESLNITLEDLPGADHATVSALVTSAGV